MLPLAGAAVGGGTAPAGLGKVPGLGALTGAGPGTLPRAGRGRADFWALAGTARGERVVDEVGRGAVTGIPAGMGVGVVPVVAMPGLGVGLRLIFSACRAAVAGAGAGMLVGRDFSRETISLSMVPLSFSSFWLSWEAHNGSAVAADDVGEVATAVWETGVVLAAG
ncbi:MAG: hypothetical protein RL549_975 [Verrucomicrobiota bacterium]